MIQATCARSYLEVGDGADAIDVAGEADVIG